MTHKEQLEVMEKVNSRKTATECRESLEAASDECMSRIMEKMGVTDYKTFTFKNMSHKDDVTVSLSRRDIDVIIECLNEKSRVLAEIFKISPKALDTYASLDAEIDLARFKLAQSLL